MRDALVALLLAAVASLVAGLTLAAMTEKLEALPGLLLLVPAAIAVKGNIFGALGSRLGTSIHAGTFRLTRRVDSVAGQNAAASMALSLVTAVLLALMAKAVAWAFDIAPTMSLADFVVVSTVGGLVASIVVLVITLAVTAGSVRFGWDLDNVVAPLVSAAGDVVTLPALVVSAELAGLDVVSPVSAGVAIGGAAVAVVWSVRERLELAASIVRESIPILALAGLVDLVAGVVVEKRLDDFVAHPALLVLLPGYLGTAGALGGVLSSRLATKLHLGLLRGGLIPSRPARADIGMIFVMSVPVFVALGLIAHFGSVSAGQASPGPLDMLAVALLGGLLATVFVVGVAYGGTVFAVRFGLDPDTYGIPMVTSALDLVGAFTFLAAALAVGVV